MMQATLDLCDEQPKPELPPSSLDFFVAGNVKSKGSFKAYMPPNARFPVVTNANPKTRIWENQISLVADQTMGTRPMIDGPVTVILCFVISRPPSVKRSKRPWPSVMPDLDKLSRAVLDALTGVVIRDDAQVCGLNARKVYDDGELRPGVQVTVCLAK